MTTFMTDRENEELLSSWLKQTLSQNILGASPGQTDDKSKLPVASAAGKQPNKHR